MCPVRVKLRRMTTTAVRLLLIHLQKKLRTIGTPALRQEPSFSGQRLERYKQVNLSMHVDCGDEKRSADRIREDLVEEKMQLRDRADMPAAGRIDRDQDLGGDLGKALTYRRPQARRCQLSYGHLRGR
jgi:hypothetical protein